ncbi:sensor domain-containing phosphodiesterase [Stutzerimonas chloritidismutans]|uniref:sensor domain-containing phosphodiesterase n=1 Tax=Stutzerimonas chloritidismutans TaxID=203192 RepID=UPI003F183710
MPDSRTNLLSSLGSDPVSALARLDASQLSVGEMLSEALRSVKSHLRMEVAFISQFRDGQRVFRYIEGQIRALPLKPGDAGPLEDSYCQRVVDGRLPSLIRDATELREALSLPITRELPVGAHLSVPIRFSDGTLYGTFCCFSTEPDDTLRDYDVSTLHLFAQFAGRLLERHAASEKVFEERLTRISQVLAERSYHTLYQPIMHLLDQRVVGYEALARFHPEPYRSPDKWFDEAGQVGLRSQLEIALLEEALRGLDLVDDNVYLSLNACPSAILDGSVVRLLSNHPLERLMLEVTEHSSIDDYAVIASTLEPLRRRGLRLAVDDAGAGYASFRHILKLRPDVIKLDRSLITNVDTDTHSRALAAALIRFAEETGCKIIAEGVETENELAVLRQLNVIKAQGYLLGHPQRLAGQR